MLYATLLHSDNAAKSKGKDVKYMEQVKSISIGWTLPERIKSNWPDNINEEYKLVRLHA